MGGGGHGHDAQVGVLHGPQLPLQEDGFVLLAGLVEEGHGVPHIGADDLPQRQQLGEELFPVHRRLVVHGLEEDVLDLHRAGQVLPQAVLLEEVADLDADLGVLVRVEGGDAALGGAEGVAAQAGLLIGVLEDVIGQQELGPLRHDQVGGGDPGLLQGR